MKAVALACMLLTAALPTAAHSAISTSDLNSGLTPNALVNALLGSGVTASNITFNGDNSAAGTFTGGTSGIGFENGVILSSGNIAGVPGPNDLDDTTTAFGRGGDPDLDALIPGFQTFDAAVLEFDFVPSGNAVTFQYVFSSEEYNEFANDAFNDVFGFFVNGVNRALLPDGVTPVSINNVNGGNPFGFDPHNPAFYVNNDCDDPACTIDIEPDGKTVVLSLTAPVIANQTNHMKLTIADSGDDIFDSWVFIKGESITLTETICDNGLDDDGDGLVDHNDPDCACRVFPLAGADTVDTSAVVTVEIIPLAQTDRLELSGPTVIQRGNPFDPGDGRREIDTEIISMSLVGTSGLIGPVRVIESPTLASIGKIKAQSPGADFPADSFFDVFFEIETALPPPLDRLRSCVDPLQPSMCNPLRMQQVIRCIPPLGAIYQPPANVQKIPLFDSANRRVAILIHAQHQVIGEACGDGFVDAFEECDDGNLADCDGCDRNCTVTRCGNGIVCTPPEECDDGNTVDGDGCSAVCGTEDCICGNGVVEPQCGEDCDDGNPFPGDCCNPSCRFEFLSTACEADANLCTIDHCDGAGTCVFLDSVVCPDDGDVCNGPEACDPLFGCVSGPPAPLSTPCEADGDSCTTDHCDGEGECVFLKSCPVAKPAALCQKQIGKQGQKFKKKKLKAWQKCLDGTLSGTGCDAAARDAAIAAAEDHFVANVAKKCTAELLFALPPDGLGFAQSCDFEPGPLGPAEEACRALPVSDTGSLTRCLICWKQAELHELLKILYPCLAAQVPEGSDLDCGTPPAACPTDKSAVLCTRAIAKAGINFFLTKEKALEQCLDAVRRGAIPGPCPDPAAQAKIAAAEGKKIAQIQQCAQTPPWWDVCPEDSSAPCDQAITSLGDIAACVDRAAEEIADELICQQYPRAAGDGISCPPPEGSPSGAFLELTSPLG